MKGWRKKWWAPKAQKHQFSILKRLIFVMNMADWQGTSRQDKKEKKEDWFQFEGKNKDELMKLRQLVRFIMCNSPMILNIDPPPHQCCLYQPLLFSFKNLSLISSIIIPVGRYIPVQLCIHYYSFLFTAASFSYGF